MKVFLRCGIVLGLLAGTAPVLANYDKGLTLYEQGIGAHLLPELQLQAEQGNVS